MEKEFKRKKQRPREKTYIFGRHPVEEALDTGIALEKILVLSGARSGFYKEIMAKAEAQNVPVKKVPREKMDWLTQKNHQGIIAFYSPVEYQSLENVLSQSYESGELPFFVLLDGVSDVRNVGAIARSALCFGATALVTSFKGSAAINEEAVKASAGALLTLPLCRVPDIKKSIQYLQANGLSVFATAMDVKKKMSEMDFKVPLALVMGDEGKGVSDAVYKLCDESLSIPMVGNFDSLNVSVATGILVYEISKGRG